MPQAKKLQITITNLREILIHLIEFLTYPLLATQNVIDMISKTILIAASKII